MDGRFQGMMTYVGGRFDAMQSHFDGQYSNLNNRFTVVDTQLDGVHSQFADLRTHIHDTVHDPIMSRMNNMQQNFQDNMGALSSQFQTLSTSDSIHSLDARQQQIQNDFSQFTSISDSFSSHYYNMYMRPPPGAQ
jgi:ABC-type phosphate transport system auxiliary subunit